MSTTADGMHRDVPIVHVEKHPAYNISGDAKNDIMILYLKYDIEINGTIEVYFSIQRNIVFINGSVHCNVSCYTDRMRPICLPIEGSMRDESFIKNTNPFVAGWGVLSEVSQHE